ncbi:hypothetical protein GF322_03295 [Candidatus Dependentiae bacterium]|nr:hypothetical protein [Candidatus Dependentiae bacterium]
MITKKNSFVLVAVFAMLFSNVFCQEITNKTEKTFGDSDFEITIKFSGETNISKEKLILNTIEKLIKDIDPNVAAKEYVEYMKSTFEQVRKLDFGNVAKDCKTIEEVCQNISQMINKLQSELTTKEKLLKQSVAFASFTDEAIKDINLASSNEMQKYFLNINTFIRNKTKNIDKNSQEEVDKINKEIQEMIPQEIDILFDGMINNVKNALSKHYKID